MKNIDKIGETEARQENIQKVILSIIDTIPLAPGFELGTKVVVKYAG